MAPLVVSDLHKSFGSQKVLDGVDLTAERGKPWWCWGEAERAKAFC